MGQGHGVYYTQQTLEATLGGVAIKLVISIFTQLIYLFFSLQPAMWLTERTCGCFYIAHSMILYLK